MYECYAWIAPEGTEDYAWVKGWDVGTTTVPFKGHMTVFCPDDVVAEEGYSLGYYLEDWQLCYGREKPTHEGSEHELINQTLKSI